jgi:flavin-dependent dehydrogenase
VVYFTDADLVCGLRRTMEERWTDLLQNTRLTKQQLADGRPDRPLLVRPASSTIAEPVVGNRWLTVGDAACTIDPLSSQGIVRALTTGIEAAEALMETSPEEAVKRYAANVTLWYQNYLNTRRQFYAREGRWPDSPFWRRGSGSTVGPAAGARSAAKESTVA